MSVRDELNRHGIGLRRMREGENRTACPWCAKDKRDDALAVKIEGDRAVYLCHRCHASGVVGERSRHTAPASPPSRAPKRVDGNARQWAARIWADTLPLANTAGADYLTLRACMLPPADGDLRFHPRLRHMVSMSYLPALVARVSTVRGNRFVGVHRIYIKPGSDKAIDKLRLGGCDEPVCVRLWPDDAVERALYIAEGIETALAAAHIRRPVWSTLDAGGMERFPVLEGVETLGIFADNDSPGILAAATCGRRWRDAGRTATAVKPAAGFGNDINDLVRKLNDRAA